MKLLKNNFLFALIFFLLTPLFTEPSLESSIKINFASDHNLLPEEIIMTALEYSFCPIESEEGKICLLKFNSLKSAATRKFSDLSQIEAAEQLLAFLYESVLFKYSEGATYLNTTLLTGEYNCVTASILYLSLAKALGIRVYGQETKLHAFCTVYIDEKNYDVETTNPYGFNPGVKKETSRTENSRSYTYVPKKYYAGRRQVSDRAFATLTGKNIASDLNDTEDFDRAIPLEISRLEFLLASDDSEVKTARADLDTLVTNYAIIQTKAKKSQEGAYFIEKTASLWNWTQELSKTYYICVYNAIADSLNKGDLKAAREMCAEKEPFLDAKDLSKLKATINRWHEVEVHNKFANLYNAGKKDEALSVLQTGLLENPESSVLKKDLQRISH